MQGLRVEGADMESDVPELVRFPAGTERIIQIAAGEVSHKYVFTGIEHRV